MKVSGSWLQAFTERDVKVVSYSCKIWVAKVQMVKAHLCFEKYDLSQLLTRIIEEVQSDFRTRRTVSSFSLGPASIGLPVTFVILTNHFSSYPPAETLYLVWLLNYTTSVFEAVLLLQSVISITHALCGERPRDVYMDTLQTVMQSSDTWKSYSTVRSVDPLCVLSVYDDKYSRKG